MNHSEVKKQVIEKPTDQDHSDLHFSLLLPYIRFYKQHWFAVILTLLLSLVTLFSALGLLSVSGWLISSAVTLSAGALLVPSYFIRLFAVTRMLGRWAERVIGHEVTFRVLSDLRLLFFKKIAPLYPMDLNRFRRADLLNRLVTDVDHMDQFYLRCFNPFVTAFIGNVLISSILAAFNLQIALLFFCSFLAMLFLLPVLFFISGRSYGILLNEAQRSFRVQLVDWLRGYSELIVYNAEERAYQALCQGQEYLLAIQKKMHSITTRSIMLSTLLTNMLLISLLWFASGLYPFDSTLVVITLFLTMASFEMITPIGAGFQYLSQTMHSAKQLDDILTATPTVTYGVVEQSFDPITSGDLQFEEVTFRYPGQREDQFKQFNFKVDAGDKIIISGHTGSGKSTLFQLLTRQYQPQNGSISHCDTPLKEYTEETLRSLFCVIHQRVEILSASLRDNLLLANPHATDEQLKKILSDVELDYLTKENGLELWLGEGGRQLSGGEGRRLGIARALLHNAPIILADEPTEGLDMETQETILALFERYFQSKTVIIITHRQLNLNFIQHEYQMIDGRLVRSN